MTALRLAGFRRRVEQFLILETGTLVHQPGGSPPLAWITRMHINGFALIGRLGAPSVCCRTTDRFELARLTYAEWQKDRG